jgi:hypothetical protein
MQYSAESARIWRAHWGTAIVLVLALASGALLVLLN